VTRWIRFDHRSETRIGVLEGDEIAVHQGELFGDVERTDKIVRMDEVDILTPCLPTKMIGLANNSKSLAEKHGTQTPDYPHYFIKPSNTFLPSGATIRNPGDHVKRVFYEAEYTCVNDVTAFQLLDECPHFPQWTRAKAFDTFAPFGPVIGTDIELEQISIRAILNGRERQNYRVSDLIFAPHEIVSMLSAEITLFPGDVVACGTGPGALPMKPGSEIEIEIGGIGTLRNVFQ